MTAAQGGDRKALDQLLRRHYDRMHAVCRRITGNEADAADAAQEAMIAVVRGLPRFDGRSAFGTWVYRIATNASLDELRRRRRRPLLSSRDSYVNGKEMPEAIDVDGELRIDHMADRFEISAALSDLPEDFRVPVVLRDVADLDYSEIAEILNVPIGTVKSRIARGRAQVAASISRGNSGGSGNQSHGLDRQTPGTQT